MLDAIAANPDYADAHFNLAVIYATNQPPAKELAKQHYVKATSLGAEPDPSLENCFDRWIARTAARCLQRASPPLLSSSAERSIHHAETFSHRELAIPGDAELRRRPENPRAVGPAGTELDFHDGQTFLSVVGFLFLDTRVIGLPIPLHRNFEEVNLRFYVRRKSADEWRRGVVFVRELVPRRAIAFVARTFYGEPYSAAADAAYSRAQGGARLRAISMAAGRRWETLAMTATGEPQTRRRIARGIHYRALLGLHRATAPAAVSIASNIRAGGCGPRRQRSSTPMWPRSTGRNLSSRWRAARLRLYRRRLAIRCISGSRARAAVMTARCFAARRWRSSTAATVTFAPSIRAAQTAKYRRAGSSRSRSAYRSAVSPGLFRVCRPCG